MKTLQQITMLCLFGLILLASCKKDKDDKEPVSSTETIIGENTKALDNSARAAIASIDTSAFTFTVNSGTDFFTNLKEGDIVVDSSSALAPHGYLRKVTHIEDQNGSKLIHTEQAALYEAIPQAHFNFTTGNLKMSHLKSAKLAKGVALKSTKATQFRAFEFDFDNQFGTAENGIYVNGNSYFDINFFWEFKWSLVADELPPFEVDLLEAGIEFNQGGSILVEGTGTYDDKAKFLFASMEFSDWNIMVGPVPLVFTPTVNFYIGVDGNITSEITTGATETFNNRLGIRYDGDWSGIGTSDFDKTFIVPSISANATVEAWVGPEASLMLYGLAGPKVGLKAYTKLTGEVLPNQNFNVNFDMGIKGTAGVKLTVFDVVLMDKEIEIFDVPFNLYHIEDSPIEESISITSPIPDANLPLGEDLEVLTYYTGPDPQKVLLYFDGNQVLEDTDAPFEFTLPTSSYTTGAHQLKVKAVYADHELESDVLNISLVTAGWDIYNLNQEIGNLPMFMSLEDVFIYDETHVWASTGLSTGVIFFSNNGGDSWSKINDGSQVGNMTPATYTSTQRGFAFDGSYNFVYTEDGGYNWKDDYPIPYQGVHLIGNSGSSSSDLIMYVWDGSKPGLAYYNSSMHEVVDTLFFSNHGYDSFDDNHLAPPAMVMNATGLFVPNLRPTGSTTHKLGIVNGSSIQTVDVGLSGDDFIVDLFFLNETEGWLSSNYNFLFKTTDGGQSWIQIFSGAGIAGGRDSKLCFVDAVTGYWTDSYTGTMKSKLYKTIDGGNTWEAIPEFVRIEGMADVKFLGSNLGFAVGGGLMDDNGYKIYRYTMSE